MEKSEKHEGNVSGGPLVTLPARVLQLWLALDNELRSACEMSASALVCVGKPHDQGAEFQLFFLPGLDRDDQDSIMEVLRSPAEWAAGQTKPS
jgi:hypothetical protein